MVCVCICKLLLADDLRAALHANERDRANEGAARASMQSNARDEISIWVENGQKERKALARTIQEKWINFYFSAPV